MAAQYKTEGSPGLPAIATEVRDFARSIDARQIAVYHIPMTTRFRGITAREGMVIEGPAGWGEFCPFAEYDDEVSSWWLLTALEAAVLGWPAPVRDRIAINATVPAVSPARAREIVVKSGCMTAKVKVADHPGSLSEDLVRVEAVRDALGPQGAIRVDANGAWDVDTAVHHLAALDRAAGGLQYAEQPCPTIEELAGVRRRVDVPIAADESIRRAEDPMRVAVAGAADVAIIKCTPLGGVRRSLAVAEAAGLPAVVSSALETSVGLSSQLALAGALPSLDYACGLGTLSLLTGDTVDPLNSLVVRDGAMSVVPAPPVADRDRLTEFAQTDPARRQWWVDRLSRVLALLIND